MHVAGVIFCLLLAATMVLFPLLKGEPVGFVPLAAGLLASAGLLYGPVRRAITRVLCGPRGWQFAGAVFLLALGARLGYCAAFHHEPGSDDAFYHAAAVDLLEGKGYVYMGGEPTAFYPPGNSMRLAAWYAAFGRHYLSGWVMNAALGAVLSLLTWSLCARVFFDAGVARWAAALMALHPAAVASSAGLGYGVLLSCVLVGALLLAIGVVDTAGRRRWLYVVALGLLLGAGCLVKPICLLVPALLGVAWLIMGCRWQAVAWALACGLVVVAVVAPWTIRNYRVFGTFIAVSTNGGNALYTANNPQSRGVYMRIEATPEELDPATGQVDEVRRDRNRRRLAIAWITNHPGDWVAIWPYKLSYLWGSMAGLARGHNHGRAVVTASKAILNFSWALLLAPVAVGTLRRRAWANPRVAPLGLLVFYLTGLHLFFESGCRHAAVALPAIMAFAAAALAARPDSDPSAGPRRQD